MRVKESDLGEVMLSVFNELNLPERGLISLQTIEQNWAHTGLRQNDVATALRVLEDNGHLSHTERAYELTPAGFAAMVKTSSAYQRRSGSQVSTMCSTSSATPRGDLRRCVCP